MIGLVLLVPLLVVVPQALPAAAADTVTVTKSAPSEVLVGEPLTFTLTASAPASNVNPVFNGSFRDVLPVGVRYVPGSASPAGVGEPRIVTAQVEVSPGVTRPQQTLLWVNIGDLQRASTFSLTFRAEPIDPAWYPAGSTMTNAAGGYGSTNPRQVPRFDAQGRPVLTPTTVAGEATPTTTRVTALQVTKSEPSPEGELFRGVHSNTTVYTLRVRTAPGGGTNGTVLTDYLPAGLEFLGCGGVDNTPAGSPAPNVSGVEYPTAPRLTATPAPPGCQTPATVTTVVNPTGPGVPPGLAGVYTQVTWNLGTLPPLADVTLRYAAGIPLRANTLGFPTGTPTPQSGQQAANLDNNRGASTREGSSETSLTNVAAVSGTYTGPLAPGTNPQVSDTERLSRSVEDLAMTKQVSPASFFAGQIATYTLKLRASEYVTASGVVVTDTLPNGVCPLSSTANYVNGSPPDCAPVAGSDPTGASFDQVTQNADGTFTVRFSGVSVAADGTATISYRARMRTVYTGGTLGGFPTVAGDSFTNRASLTGTTSPIVVPAPGTGEVGPVTVTDDSETTLTSGGLVIDKTVKPRVVPTTCDTGPFENATSGDPRFLYRQGDRICFELTVQFPTNVGSRNVVVTDFLPAGTDYEPGSYLLVRSPGVPVEFNETAAASGAENPTWVLGSPTGAREGLFVPPGAVLTVRLAAIVNRAADPGSVDLTGNLMKVRAEDSAGRAVSLRDEAPVGIAPAPVVSVRKGVQSIQDNGTGAPRVLDPTPPGSPGTNVDGATVREADVVTFRVDVSNSGDEALGNASSVRGWQVWDVLPPGIRCAQVVPGSIGATGGVGSRVGVCTDPGSPDQPPFAERDTLSAITWRAATGLAADTDQSRINTGATRTLTYAVRVPSPVSVGTRLVDTASVRSFDVFTNEQGDVTTYFPAQNVDTTVLATDYNAPAASDPSNVVVPDTAITKRAVASSLTEPNNAGVLPGSPVPPAPQTQATNGETVTYRIGVTIPARTTVFNGVLNDPLPPDLQFVSASAAFSPTGVTGATAPLPPGFQLDSATGRVTFPTTWTNATGTPQLVEVTLVARMRPTASAHNDVKTNTSTFDRSTAATGGTALPQLTAAGTAQLVIPDPRITKSNQSTPPVAAGTPVTYQVRVTNTGGRPPAHDAIVVDCLPSGMVFVSATPLTGTVTTSAGTGGDGCASGSTRIEWRLGVPVPGGPGFTLPYTARVGSVPVGGVTYRNTATLTASTLPNGVNDRTVERVISRSASSNVGVGVATITKDVTPTSLTFGDRATFVVVATLPREIAFYDAAVIDELPAGFDPASVVTQSITCTRPDGQACVSGPFAPLAPAPAPGPGDARRIGWSLGDSLVGPADETVRITYTALLSSATAPATVDRGDTLSNKVRVGWNITDGRVPANAGASFDRFSTEARASVAVAEPLVAVTKTVDDTTPGPGDALTYRVTVANQAAENASPAFDLTVVDRLPSGVVVTSIGSGGALAGSDAALGGGSITWRLPGPVAPGASTTLEYTARLADSPRIDADPLPNTVTVEDYATAPPGTAGRRTYPTRDPRATAQVTPQFPRLEVRKSTPAGPLASIDERFTWQIVVTNTGTAPTGSLTVTDTLPPNWQFVPGSLAFSVAGAPAAIGDPEVRTVNVAGSFTQTLTATGPIQLAPGAVAVGRFLAVPRDLVSGSVVRNPGVGTSVPHTNRVTTTATDAAGFPGNQAGPYTAGPATADARIASADLSVTKTPSGEVVAGQQISWTITVRNDGPDDALRSVSVLDRLPIDPADPAPDPVFVSATGDGYTCSLTGADLLCTRAMTTADGAERPLPPSTSETIIVILAIPSDVPAGTVYTNRARVAGSTYDPDLTNNQTTAEVTVSAIADLEVVKRLSGSAVAGTIATYTLNVRNNGPSTARADVQVVDTLPPGATFRGFTGDGWDCAVDPADAERVVCVLDGDLPALTPAPQVALRVEIASGQTADVVNTAEVSSTVTPDPVSANDTSTVTTPVQTVADLVLEKESVQPPPFTAGEPAAVYRFRVLNAGPSDAGSLTLTDLLPAGLTFVGVTDPADGWACTAAPGDQGRDLVICDRPGGLVDEAETSVSITVAIDEGLGVGLPSGQLLEILNVAEVTSPTVDPVPQNNRDDDLTTSPREADLALTKTHVPEPVVAGGSLTFTLGLRNDGLSTAARPVVVRDRLPEAFAFAGFGGTTGWECSHDRSAVGGLVTCVLGDPGRPGDLVVGAAPAIDVEVLVLASAGPAQVLNQATADSLTPDPELANNLAQDVVTIEDGADIGISKATTGQGPVPAGETTQFTLAVGNDGPSDADSVSVADVLPAGLLVAGVDAAAPWECTGLGTGTLDCRHTVPLPPGEAAPILVTARVAPDVPDGTTLTNSARVSTSTSQGPNERPDQSTSTLQVIARSDLQVRKTLQPPDSACTDACAGETVAFTLAVTNAGPSTAVPSVRVLDTLPPGVTYVDDSDPLDAWQCTPGPVSDARQDVACVLVDPATGRPAALAPQDPAVPSAGVAPPLTLRAAIDPAPPPGTLTNTTLVTSPTTDPVPGNNESAADVQVQPLVDLGISKSHTGPVRIGDALTFTLEVTSAGPSLAEAVRIQDVLPVGLSDPVVQPLDDAPWTCQVATPDAAGTPLDCLLGTTLAPGATAALTVTVLVGPQAFPSVSNTADVTTDTPESTDPDELPDSATDVVDVPPQVDLAITKTHEGGFTVGRPGQFVLTVGNSGPTLDPGPVTVTDVLPAVLRPTAAAGDGWACQVQDARVTCTDEDGLAVGETSRIVVTVDVLPEAVPAATNEATVSSDAEDLQPDNNAAQDTVDVSSAPDQGGGGLLPGTGATVLGMLAIACLLVLGGLGLLRSARRG